jgi:menaquinone-dependent protoporphyrinogen oxidase
MSRPQILVVYGTTEGHTRKVAAAMARTLRAAGADVDVVNAASRGLDPRPDEYAAVIVAASVHAGSYQAAVRSWVKAHAVCLAVLERSAKADEQLALILRQFYDATGWQPTESKIVAGALLYRQYNWLKRWLMKRIVTRAKGDTDTSRDYEYTDWQDLAVFTARFGGRVLAGTVDVSA